MIMSSRLLIEKHASPRNIDIIGKFANKVDIVMKWIKITISHKNIKEVYKDGKSIEKEDRICSSICSIHTTDITTIKYPWRRSSKKEDKRWWIIYTGFHSSVLYIEYNKENPLILNQINYILEELRNQRKQIMHTMYSACTHRN